MFNYINAELSRLFHKKSAYVYYAVLIALFLFFTLFVGISLVKEDVVYLAAVILSNLSIIFVGAQVFLAVYVDDLAANSLVNVFSSGLNKIEFVVSKLIVTLIYSICWYLVLALVYLGVYAIAQGPFAFEPLMELLPFVYFSLLAQLAFTAVASIVNYFFQKSSVSTVVFILLGMGFVSGIVMLLGTQIEVFRTLYDYLISTQLGIALFGENANTLQAGLIMVAYIIVSSGIVVLLLEKRDIKS